MKTLSQLILKAQIWRTATTGILGVGVAIGLTLSPASAQRFEPAGANPAGSANSAARDWRQGGTTPLIRQTMPAWSGKGTGNGLAKASTDKLTVYRPLTVCHLIDTRGIGSPVFAGPVFAANERRTFNNTGGCGVPTSGVAGLALAFYTLNTTPNSGGTLSFLPPGGALTGLQDIFNGGTAWSAGTTNVITSFNGSFDVLVNLAAPHLMVDVLGYYEDMDQVTHTTEIDYTFTGSGDGFQLSASDVNGSALTTGHSLGTGTALKITNGALKVSGAGLNSSTFVFQTKVNTAGTKLAGTGTLCFVGSFGHVIDNPLANADPGAILIITPVSSGSSTGPFVTPVPVIAEYAAAAGCGGGVAGNKWTIFQPSAFTNGQVWNVMIIKP
jgi:hypothetical protein